jgi:CheY-like chemotaxis protein
METPATNPPPLRVVIASDQPIYLRGLTAMLLTTADTHLIGEAQTGAEMLQLCELTSPDLVVLDLRSSHGRSRELVRALHQRHPGLRIVILQDTSENGDEEDVFLFSRDVSEAEFKTALDQLRHNLAPRAIPHEEEASPEEPFEPSSPYVPLPSRQLIPYRNQELLTRELVMAGRIQADILPEEPPIIRGWDIAATLQPARETSGDFYDFIPLSPHKWGLVIADVTDKGMGAALLMALCSTLIRTFAGHFPTLPAFTLRTVSERILSDTRGGMFVTAFYGILETHTGRFLFANAGHPPGYLVCTRKGKETADRLTRTGMAMGVSEDARWQQKSLRLEVGDLLLLYTDGISEAQNPGGASYGEERLLEVVLSKAMESANQIREAVLDDVRRFMGNSPRQDDIAIVVIKREA